MKKIFILLVIISIPVYFSFAHSGDVDVYGCHSGGLLYHCHNNDVTAAAECGYIRDRLASMSTIDAAYAKCIRDHKLTTTGDTGYTAPSINYSYPSYPTTPTCPSMSSYDSSSGKCKCYSGYLVSNGSCVDANYLCYSEYGFSSYYDISSNICKCNEGYIISDGICTSGNIVCHKKLGYGSSYDQSIKNCKCDPGYIIGNSGQCVSAIIYCSDQIGLMSQYNDLLNKCECISGYEFDGSKCSLKKTCPLNSTISATDSTKCVCNIGYQNDIDNEKCVTVPVKARETIKPIIKKPASTNSISSLKSVFATTTDDKNTNKAISDIASTLTLSTSTQSSISTDKWYKKIWKYIWRF